jgi:hypothetical protein
LNWSAILCRQDVPAPGGESRGDEAAVAYLQYLYRAGKIGGITTQDRHGDVKGGVLDIGMEHRRRGAAVQQLRDRHLGVMCPARRYATAREVNAT